MSLLLDAALPPGAPWWGVLVLASIGAVPGVVAVVLEIVRRREGDKSVAKELASLRAEQAKLVARLDELEDDGTDPDVRAARHERLEERIERLEQRLTESEQRWVKWERRAEEAAKLDLEIQRTLGRVEGFMAHHDPHPR